jgi:fused signal recognition particle receptor
LHALLVWVAQNVELTVLLALVGPSVLALLLHPLLRPKRGVALPEVAPDTVEVEPASPVDAEPVEAAAPEPFVERVEPAEPVEAPIAEAVPATQAELFPEPEPEPKPEPVPVSAPEPVAQPRVSLRDRLTRTSETLVGRLGGLLGGRKVDADLLEELEALLFTADLGVRTAESLLDAVRQKAAGADASVVRDVLRAAMLEKLQKVQPVGEPLSMKGRPHVILVLGVNGSGKTTTIGKLAARYAAAGRKVILGAGDTFRAAATEQLQVWGDRVGCEVIAGKSGGDPAAVAFDTVKAAVARGADVAIIDTAGRLQTKKPLMEELGKIARVLSRDIDDAPHETLLVLECDLPGEALHRGDEGDGARSDEARRLGQGRGHRGPGGRVRHSGAVRRRGRRRGGSARLRGWRVRGRALRRPGDLIQGVAG